MKKLTIKDILSLKRKRQIILSTAHDYYTAKACEAAGIDIICTSGLLPKGSIDTNFAILEVARKGAPNTVITSTLPFGIPYISDAEAIRCAVNVLKNGADMIYYTGMTTERIKELAKYKIPCVGHVGLVPLNATWFGGMRAVGKTSEEALKVYKDTLAFQEAGAVAVEMECVPFRVAEEITKRVDILTFSMGSGSGCDGQYVFSCDILGSHDGHYPRHSKKYCDFFNDSVKALKNYKEDVFNGNFPKENNIIDINDEEFDLFLEKL